MSVHSKTEQVAVGLGLVINSTFSALNFATQGTFMEILNSYRRLSNLIVMVSQVYFTIRAVNVFSDRDFAVDFNNLLGQLALVGQTMTTIAYWFIIYWNTKFFFADEPLTWISQNLSHGVPLLALFTEQIFVPTVYD